MQTLLQLTDFLLDMVPMAQEVYLFCFFWLGFIVFRSEAFQQLLHPSPSSNHVQCGELQQGCSVEQLTTAFRDQQYNRVLESWAFLEKYTIDALSIVVTAMIALGRTDDIGIFISKAIANHPHLQVSLHETISAIAAPPSEAQCKHVILALRSIYEQMRNDLDSRATEVLTTAFARFNDEQRVSALLPRLTSPGQAISVNARCKIVLGFLSCKNVDASLTYLRQVFAAMGCRVPVNLVVAVVKCVTEASSYDGSSSDAHGRRAWEAWELLESADVVPIECCMLLLEWASRKQPPDVALAARIEKKIFRTKDGGSAGSSQVPFAAYDALVRVNASSAGDQTKARWYFDELVSATCGSCGLSEGSLVGILSSCVEARNSDLAERVLNWARQHNRCTVRVFSAAVKVLAVANLSEKICDQYQSIASDDLELDDATYGQLFKHAVQAGKRNLAQDLFRLSGKPDVQSVMSLISACGQEGDIKHALNLLRDLRDRGVADTSVHNCTLDVCILCKDRAATRSVFEMMQASGNVDVISYNILLKQYVGEGGNLRAAEALLEEMRRSGFKPNISTYNSMIGGAVAAGDFHRAWQTIAMMEASSGPGVDAYTITILCKGYKRERQVMDARSFDRILGLIHFYSVKVDETLVNLVLEACVSLRNEKRLMSALEIFRKSGWTTSKQCSMHTYGLFIKAYGQSHQLDMAWNSWNEVTCDKGLVPTEQLYGQMIDVLVTNDCLDDALVLFEGMKETYGDHMDSRGFAVAFAMIIKGYAQRKECPQAMRCYEEMQMHKANIGLVVFNTLIDACSRVGDMGNAARLFRDMMDAQCPPDLITYSTLIKGYCVRDELSEAMELFSLMRRKGIKPDSTVFNIILDGCAKKKMPALCEQVIKDMEEAGVPPSNYSASILIKLYGRCNDVNAAFRVFDEMPRKYGFRPNAAVYTCLMSTCISNGRFDLAMGLHARMVETQCRLDEKTYSTLLRGALRAGSVDQCMRVVQAALDQGGRGLLDEDLVKSVLLLIQRRNLWEEHGQHVLDRLREVGHPVKSCPDPQAQRSEARNSRRRSSASSKASEA